MLSKRYSISVICLFVILQCSPSLALGAEPIGWVTVNGGVTGGEGGDTVTVRDLTEFRNALNSSEKLIIQIHGIISFPTETLDAPEGDKTIIGVDPNSGWNGCVKVSNPSAHNIILRNLTLRTENRDALIIQQNATNVWVDHCTFPYAPDELMSVKDGADYITVSWCKFEFPSAGDHQYAALIGSTDDHPQDIGHLNITWHHNWFADHVYGRMPRVRYGKNHVFNNYYGTPQNTGSYCIAAAWDSQLLIENNYFYRQHDPYEIWNTGTVHAGMIKASGNVLVNCTGGVDPGDDDVFTPPYSYTLDDALDIPTMVQSGAGANDTLAHWLYTFYGDFDKNGRVNIKDLSLFANYWLDTDDINDADYYEDGIVNGREYALFAGNWLKGPPPDTNAPEAPEDLWALAGDAMVHLDWDDNTEEDVNGYNVFRSTTSGSGYTRLNTSLMSSSDYTDYTVSNDTMYYYVVTAVDTNENESSNSVEACALPGTDGNNAIIQEFTTGFCRLDGDIENVYSGYTGWGYTNTEEDIGSYIDWRINIVSAGTYTFRWRFANDSDDRPADLLANGSIVVWGIEFPDTGGWDSWSELSIDVSLSTGVKTMRLEAIDDYGLANIDYLMVTGPSPQVAACP